MQQFVFTTVGFDNSELEEYLATKFVMRMQGMSGYPERTHEAEYATVDSTTSNLGGTFRVKIYS